MTLNEAKDFYISMECSLFAMAREDIDKYNHYKELEITKSKENSWKREWIMKGISDIKGKKNIGNEYAKISEKAEEIKDVNILKLLLDLIESNCNTVSDIDKLVICETINGRKSIKARSGLIFCAYDIGAKILAQKYLEIETSILANIEEQQFKKRVINCYNICSIIANELNLEFSVVKMEIKYTSN